ncbi:hypothetical protein [Flavobacterium hungaricum]|uniref:Carboxypeptidase regulatory-like domain-containing protein n=1 Tax=Flavobacterium hungaricum TaxID=2082725 RepID=A0ABR9TFM9_9FLAO|nr:hypothetical protein [Flavobacterium hungaricum]MBE8724151.1 hypothetical protein [Flavobacterium hungaricum]
MKKNLLLFLTVFTFSSCEIQYDGETRFVVQGQLIDKENNPIADKRIEINTYSDGTYGDSDLISYTNTDTDGKFTMIFPAPKSDDIDIITTINGRSYIDYNSNLTSDYQSKNIKTSKRNFSNYKLDFNKIVLYKNDEITQLEVVLNSTTNNKEITEVFVEGNLAESIINLDKNEDENQYITTHFDVAKNQI